MKCDTVTEFKACINNYIHRELYDVITYPCPKFNNGLACHCDNHLRFQTWRKISITPNNVNNDTDIWVMSRKKLIHLFRQSKIEI